MKDTAILKELKYLLQYRTDNMFGTVDYEGFGEDVAVFIVKLEKKIKRKLRKDQ